MGRKHDIFNTNQGQVREEFRSKGRPTPREATSQQAQLASGHRHGTNKSVKVPFAKKIGR